MAWLQGGALTRFGTGKDPQVLVSRVAKAALDDAHIDRGDVDALVVANAAAEGFTNIGNVSVWTATQAGLPGVPALRVDTGPSSGLAALWTAHGLLNEPGIEHVLVLGWETMTTVPTSEATRVLSTLMSPHEQALGLSLPGLVGLMASAYLDAYDVDPQRLDDVAVKAHRLASNNPVAQFKDPVRREDVEGSPMIADPLRLFHCAPLTDGAAACVLAEQGPVRIDAMGQATDALGLTQRRSPPERFEATGLAAERAFERSSRTRREVDVVETHDAFTVLELVNVEDLGFAREGEGQSVVLDPPGDPLEGDLVVNPSGGLKARGHPIGATGLAQTVECLHQLTGEAPNQAPGAEVAVAHNIGGFGNNVHVAIFEVDAS